MVTYIKSDLEFILKQIKIAEAHAAGQPLYGPGGLIPTYNLAWGLRTVNGEYNNLLHPEWGSADNPFPEPLGNDYRDAQGGMLDPDGPGPAPSFPTAPNYNPSTNPNNVVIDGSVRTISNLIVDQTLDNPAAIMVALQRAGIVPPPGMTLLDIAISIRAEYQPVKPFVEAAEAAHVADVNAQRTLAAALAATPQDPVAVAAAQTAAAVTASASATADANLATARGPLDVLLAENGIKMDGDNISLPNIAPDEGLSASFNSWFTLFGQFFDHGLDLVGKGGSGTVFIPLQPDDPLYDPTSPTNFMVLTRATVGAGPDGILDNPDTLDIESTDDVRPINTTTPFVDQNQTYTSHASHQVFLREYILVDGKPQATGGLLDGANGGLPTWAEIKAQAKAMLGIDLTDYHVGNLPLLATDEYGNFIPHPVTGFAQVVMVGNPPTLASGTPANPLSLVTVTPDDASDTDTLPQVTHLAVRTGHAFLDDIAHTAVPVGKIADGDIEIGLANTDGSPVSTSYDNELLDAHFVTGDGRGNENIGLTAVHHVFHSEHNRLMAHTKDVILATNDLAFINEWLDVGLTALTQIDSDAERLALKNDIGRWDGERLFQAAKFGTEMQYQHLVFEEFARKIQPNINVFLVPDGYDVTIDPTILAEFAHVVYRFGHSMLTETIDRYDPSFTPDQIGLIEGFLNPLEFASLPDDEMAGSIIRGMTRQVGNHIDEFVTSALRNNLLGLPLDLATINLARGRDTGVPSLNEARRQFYEATGNDAILKPYESWVEFASHLKHEASIINFIAAYGTHPLITAETTVEGKRDAAITLILGEAFGKFAAMDPAFVMPEDREAFLNGTDGYAATLGGLENVDLWIGGLAEAITPFGGMLGSTFNFVFETQMEKLQNGDRFYYLQRLDGLHLFGEMEANSFAAMIMRNTDATHLPSDVFSTPGLILEVDITKQFNDLDGDGILESTDPIGDGLLTQLVIRNNPATSGPDTNYLRYTGGDHVLLGGTNNADILIAGIGDDTLFGDGGNDNLEGGHGNDIINAGDGDDIVRDMGGDDNIKGGDGNDAIHAGPGLDLVMGGRGQDFIVLGTDMGSEVFAGEGNDFIFGNKNAERILGNEGDDWIETGTFDGAPGDNFDEIFAHDEIDGNDVFLGDGGFDEFIGEGGDDIMVGSPGRGKMAGMSGFDWATYKDNVSGVTADLSIPIVFDEAPVLPQNASLDEYESMEGLSGSAFNDILKGSEEDATTRVPAAQGGSTGYLGSALDAQGIALINGLQAVLGTGVTSFLAGDIILGGDGSDEIQGNAGDDIIDGDKWLDVQIGVFATTDPNHTGTPLRLVKSMKELTSDVFAGLINPGQLSVVRTIRTDATPGDIDTAVFRDVSTNFSFSLDADGRLVVSHAIEDGIEGTDTLSGIERLRFTDGTYALIMGTPFNDNGGTNAATDRPVLNGTDANEIIVGLAGSDILNGNGGNDVLIGGTDAVPTTYADNFEPANYTGNDGTANFTGGWTEANDGTTSPSGGDIEISGGRLRFDENIGGGESISRTFSLAGASSATVSFSYEDDSLDDEGTDENVVVEAWNGTTWDALGTLGSTTDSGTGTFTANLSAAHLRSDAAIRFRAEGNWEDGENFYIDNFVVSVFRGDQLNGGLGNDTYGFGLADGNDVITETGGTDRITIARGTAAVPLAALTAVRQANGDLTLGFNGQTVTVVDEFDNVANRVELVNFSNNVYGGTVLAGDYAISFDTNDDDDGDGVDELGPVDPNTSSLVIGTTAGDNLLGSGENDVLFGGAGNDTLTGDGGNDLLIGGAGNDDMIGNDGDDTYEVNAGGDDITENANEGIDTVMASINYDLDDLDLENLMFTGTANLNGDGNANANQITGNAGNNNLNGLGGNDIIDGGAGNDTLTGGAGSDTIIGGLGTDTAVFAGAASAYDYAVNAAGQLVVTHRNGGADGTDTLTGIENLSLGGTTYAIVTGTNVDDPALNGPSGANNSQLVLGLDGNDTLNGGAGNDILLGGAGNDIHNGGTGNDVMGGGGGNDTYIVDSAGDIVDEAANAGIDQVNSSMSFTLGANVENLTLTGTNNGVNGTGNALDNTINGSDGENQLFGGGGNDVINGGAGNDLLDGGTGNDTLNGGTGNDSIIGGEGNDTITVSDGNDTLRYTANGFGADIVNGFDADAAGGQDLIDLTGMGISAANFATRVAISDVTDPSGALITIDGGIAGAGGTIRLNGVTSASLTQADFVLATSSFTPITGTNTGQTHLGTNVPELINALGGNDTVNASGGNDVVNGGEGADILNGGEGNDTLTGGLGANAGTFADDFGGGISYTDNNGTLLFNGGWTEGGGENTDDNSGDIQVNTGSGGRLHFNEAIDGGEFIQRAFDLTGATSASVQFAYVGDTSLTGDENVTVQAWNHTTNDWQTLTGGALSTASGNFNLALSAAQIGPQSAIRFIANGNWDDGDNFFIDNFVVTASGTNLGADTVNGDAGDDTIVWNANAANPTDGRQVVNGGTEGAAGDTFVINGRTGAETYTIFTRAAFAAIVGNSLANFNAATEIIVTRNGTNNASVIAELREIEEIRINGFDPNGTGSPGGDTFNIVGDFSATSLRLNTITIDGDAGDDTIDISSLSSAHRIVFKSNGGHDTIIGTLRPQDVIELPPGTTMDDFVETTDENGVTTLSDGEHSIRYVSHGGPPIIDDDDDEEEDDEDDDDDDHVPGDDEDDWDDEDDGDDDGPDVGGPVLGTPQDDVLLGTSGGDLVFGFAGTDYIIANAGVDVIRAGAGDDFVDAGSGRDIIFADDGDDDVFGGDDDDLIYGEGGHDRLFGGSGNDLVDAGDGNDTVFGGAGNDLFVASLNDGNDTYYGGELSGDSGNDTLDMAFLTSDATVDLGTGVGGRGSAVSAESGVDTLYGVENVTTGSGNDVITMSNAVNVVDGGAGEDIFVFGSTAAAHGDTIRGFEAGDKIDLSGIDANAGVAGNDTFTLQSGQAATAPGQIVVTHETREDGEYTVISGNTAGDNAPEFRISIAGNHTLTGSDFNL
ncbi:peroxidase family protein [Devosia riboflavina]|uniref:peroxidase family protein n=1 Tax=Devosia riboflavina TaxID=46914 RepID=UPI00069019B3|nr:peroxidase family protein [Devosia riboflavina]